MRNGLRLTPAAVAVTAAALVVAACGGSSSNNNKSGGGGSATAAPNGLANVSVNQGQKKGGTLNLVSNEGWEHLDPGQSYFQVDYVVVYATQRPLYSFKPDNFKQMVPDLAESLPQVSSDGKTVTVKIKPN